MPPPVERSPLEMPKSVCEYLLAGGVSSRGAASYLTEGTCSGPRHFHEIQAPWSSIFTSQAEVSTATDCILLLHSWRV
eukprot:6550455-Karenia_brevis.AAC.1